MTAPGLLIVQIDGLSEVALRAAIRRGFAPFLGRLLERRAAVLGEWQALVPPTTPASQAGIMHGHNSDIPGFRWYEKGERRLLVANRPLDADAIARRQSNGRGLLSPDGVSIGNLMTGDARQTYLTMATVGREPRAPGTLIRLRTFLPRPVNTVRIAAGIAREFAIELFQARRQRDRDVQPRMHRGVGSAIERAFLNSAVRTLSTELVISEARSGAPVIDVDYTGYDAVAHHSGPQRPESLHSVMGIDRAIRRIVDATRRARRPYELVVLSDHGQTRGDPFETRYGEWLADFIASAMGGDVEALSPTGSEHDHWWSAVARETPGLLELGAAVVNALAGVRQRFRWAFSASSGEAELVVCASGNLAHVYLMSDVSRMSDDQIEARHPGLIRTLLDHPAVGVVMVRSGGGQTTVAGRQGSRDLASGVGQGDDPLAPYGPLAAEGLRVLDSFTNTGDIVVISTVDLKQGSSCPSKSWSAATVDWADPGASRSSSTRVAGVLTDRSSGPRR